MCYLCIEVAKNTMTPREVAKAYTEIAVDDEHFSEVLAVIAENYDFELVGNEISKVYDEQD